MKANWQKLSPPYRSWRLRGRGFSAHVITFDNDQERSIIHQYMSVGLSDWPLLTLKGGCLAGQGIASPQRSPCQQFGVAYTPHFAVGIESYLFSQLCEVKTSNLNSVY